MERLKQLLQAQQCSLVVESADGEITTYYKKGVRDLVWLLDNEPQRLRGARMADKVIGKAAAGLMINGGVREAYAEVMSRLAMPLLEAAGIRLAYGTLADRIVIPAGDNRCPLEQIVADAVTPAEVEALLRQHFEIMKTIKQ